MKRRLVILLVAALLLLPVLSGCDRTIETEVGTWHSDDGSTLLLDGSSLTLTQGDDHPLITDLPYYWDGESIYITVNGVTICAFYAYLDEDTLTLTYAEELCAAADVQDLPEITLVRDKT